MRDNQPQTRAHAGSKPGSLVNAPFATESILNESVLTALRDDRVRFLGVDAEVFDGFIENRAFDFPVDEKFMQRSQRDEAGVDLEEIAQRSAALAPSEAISAERRQSPWHPFADHIGQGLQVIGSRDQHAGSVREALSDVWHARFFARVQSVPPFGLNAITIKFLVAGHAPHIGSHAILSLENFLRSQSFVENRAASKQLRAQLCFPVGRRSEAVHPAQNAVLYISWHRRHGLRLIHDSYVVEDVFAVLIHTVNAVLNDDRNFISKRGIVGFDVRNRQRKDLAVAILVLEPFAGERGTSRCAAEHEAPRAHIGRGPDEIRDALETEHRVVNEKWNRVDAMSGIRRSRCNK